MFQYSGIDYTLTQTNGDLLLNIADNRPPAVFIYSSGVLTSSGTEITGATIVSGGNNSMCISSGGVANSTTVNSWGNLIISSGGVASSTTVDGGWMTISSGGVANSTTVNAGGMHIVLAAGETQTVSLAYDFAPDLLFFFIDSGWAESTSTHAGDITISGINFK